MTVSRNRNSNLQCVLLVWHLRYHSGSNLYNSVRQPCEERWMQSGSLAHFCVNIWSTSYALMLLSLAVPLPIACMRLAMPCFNHNRASKLMAVSLSAGMRRAVS